MRLRLSMVGLAATSLLLSGIVSANQLESSARVGEPEGRDRPNVMIILLDDVGFGQLSAFGGPYRVPNIMRLAQRGLRYTNFHTTSLCSPTRAALLTGRNHHSVGMATITETASNEPGYNGLIPDSAATLAAMLQAEGYDTYALGKWHLTPQPESGIDGPFERWPMSMGFDHWYGFHGADADQYSPGLWDDNKPVEPPHTGDYHLTTDLADHAVSFLEKHQSTDRPFFLYFATGAGHAPHQVAKEWIEKNRGRFDQGWDVVREQIFAKQKAMGLIPKDATLPPRNDAIKAWNSLSDKEKKLFARMQEVHAGFIEHTDHEIGRILDTLERLGKLDNTLIVFTSDNGASGEGGPFGSINEFRLLGEKETFAEVYAKLAELGGPTVYNHYAAGWAQAGNTPYRYWKQETHEGGVHDPMIVSWPDQIKDHGGVRPQFTHVVDVTPTVLAAVGIEAPSHLGGVKQMPIEGTAFNETFASANVPTSKKVQYFEMIGNRGLWADGWKAVTFHGRLPWVLGHVSMPTFADDRWELYHVAEDPSESHDVADQYPEKLRELKELFDQQAKLHQVYPLDDSSLVTRAAALQASFARGVTTISYDGPKIRVSESIAPWVKNRSHKITATIATEAGKADGVIVAHGGRFGGYSLYIKDGKLNYSHNYLNKEVHTITAADALPAGNVVVRFEFTSTPEEGHAGAGVGRLFVNDRQVAEAKLANTVIGPYGFSDTFDVGSDTVTPVAPDAYESPFPFGGKIVEVKFDMPEQD